jgi:amino acid transporter
MGENDPEPQTTGPGLERRTNWWGAFVIGLAGTILVTGVAPYAVQAMGAASIPVFFFCSAAAVVLCLCLAELAALMPERTGGMPSYAAETYRVFGPTVARHAGGISAWGYWLAWFPVAPINMIIAAKYIVALFGLPAGTGFTPISAEITTTVLWISLVGMIVLFIPCCFGIQLGARFATFLGLVSMVPITLLVFLPFFRPQSLHWENVAGFALPRPVENLPAFYMSWVFIMAWSVLAIEAAACYIGECRNPARDARISLGLASAYGAFIYLAVPLMLVAVLGDQMADPRYQDPLTAFLAYTQAVFGDHRWVEWAIGIPIIVALLFTVLHAIMGCGRSLYQVARDGTLPTIFGRTNRLGVPHVAMTFNLACSLGVVFFGSPLEIYIFSVTGYLLCVGLALIGYFLHRAVHPRLVRPVRMPDFLRWLALALGVFFLGVWIYGGYHAADIVVAEGKRWLFFLGLAILALYAPLYAWRRYVEER